MSSVTFYYCFDISDLKNQCPLPLFISFLNIEGCSSSLFLTSFKEKLNINSHVGLEHEKQKTDWIHEGWTTLGLCCGAIGKHLHPEHSIKNWSCCRLGCNWSILQKQWYLNAEVNKFLMHEEFWWWITEISMTNKFIKLIRFFGWYPHHFTIDYYSVA